MSSTETIGAAETVDGQRRKSMRPSLGFLGVGWIGRQRMESIARSGVAEVAAIGDAVPQLAAKAAEGFERAEATDTLDRLLDLELDGVVIATPSALHAEQTIAALKNGVAVF